MRPGPLDRLLHAGLWLFAAGWIAAIGVGLYLGWSVLR
jgi:hypothetical protein